MKLKWTDISNDKIHYTHSKTKGNFIIKILPPVQIILDYYIRDKTTQYVFPILLKDKLRPDQLENRKKNLKKYNKKLKKIAEICGVDKSVSSYVARHSFANCLKQNDFATDINSESMGHQNLAVTQAYLKEWKVLFWIMHVRCHNELSFTKGQGSEFEFAKHQIFSNFDIV